VAFEFEEMGAESGDAVDSTLLLNSLLGGLSDGVNVASIEPGGPVSRSEAMFTSVVALLLPPSWVTTTTTATTTITANAPRRGPIWQTSLCIWGLDS